MKIQNIIAGILLLVFASCGETTTIGKYKKEALSSNFSYVILKDLSNNLLEKNELFVEINEKITVGQIATLAEKLFETKEKQRRFYIFYILSGSGDNASAWAISHFDPELEIEILGSTAKQDTTSNKLADAVEGEIIGKWHEEKYTSSNYVIYKKDNKTFIRTIFKDGTEMDDELKEKKLDKRTRYDLKERSSSGEYFILNTDGGLEFYNSENKNFTTATKIP
ncbi:MAG: hypothetical protein ACJ77K_17680 [Bacteroidia bacterium]